MLDAGNVLMYPYHVIPILFLISLSCVRIGSIVVEYSIVQNKAQNSVP